MMSQEHSRITGHFRAAKNSGPTTTKTRAGSKRKETEATQPAEEAQVPAATTDLDLSPEERTLRAFDLTSKYGPCTGLTRLERWQRAAKFGLEPPQEVYDILTRSNPQDTKQQCVWHNRI
mmetsp:Transcript_37598/g.83723  ORF Transcript_37598/g.83723 Transcript_37598/m.83723 type:complete len:120 (-) Transcript_37598:806-1165(-)|eukprot:CAMPEP_0202892264 /NCGR_PEP_ID=MMETSP1392-20130828/2017_1 /ASSEMBLY_ACC=CAM_ASM_000868 /TAXON_ID=225041 /ORGANISM="Chlamydomonas chlamydogama, Strain SAG 11-48b" /LENGTH=119 /DNA_ID=CAMNT_0049576157 /DNA_START=143 /DNA_END=502 /DNA_ORIENTATION=+